ncbi:MAG: trimethylamine methyltransferase family protein, partial [Anaerolineae bacterium]
MLPTLKRNLPVVEPLDQGQIEKIDHESMRILEEVGVIYRDEIALRQWKAAGANVQGELVKVDRGLIRELIKSIPSNITLNARDPQKTVKLGGPHSIFVPMTGAPYLRDLEDVRRNPSIEDLGMFHKLCQAVPAIHSSAHHILEPMDLPVA